MQRLSPNQTFAARATEAEPYSGHRSLNFDPSITSIASKPKAYNVIIFLSPNHRFTLCPRPVLDQCLIITGRRKMTEKLLSPTKIAPNLRFSSNLKHFGFKESRHTRISADNNLKRKIVLFLIYVVVTQKNRLVETVLLRPNNI